MKKINYLPKKTISLLLINIFLLACSKYTFKATESIKASDIIRVTINEPTNNPINETGNSTYNIIIESDEILTINLIKDNVLINNNGSIQCDWQIQNGTTKNPQLTFSNCQGDGSLNFTIQEGAITTIKDNIEVKSPPIESPILTIDNTGPQIQIADISSYTAQENTTTSIILEYVGAENVNLNNDDITINYTNLEIPGSPNPSCDYTINNISQTKRELVFQNCQGDANVSITINEGTSTDKAGNKDEGFTQDNVFTIINNGPLLTITNPTDVELDGNETTTFILNFENVQNIKTNSELVNNYVVVNKNGTIDCDISVTGTTGIVEGNVNRTVEVSNCSNTSKGSFSIEIAKCAGSANYTQLICTPKAGPSATITVNGGTIVPGAGDDIPLYLSYFTTFSGFIYLYQLTYDYNSSKCKEKYDLDCSYIDKLLGPDWCTPNTVYPDRTNKTDCRRIVIADEIKKLNGTCSFQTKSVVNSDGNNMTLELDTNCNCYEKITFTDLTSALADHPDLYNKLISGTTTFNTKSININTTSGTFFSLTPTTETDIIKLPADLNLCSENFTAYKDSNLSQAIINADNILK